MEGFQSRSGGRHVGLGRRVDADVANSEEGSKGNLNDV